MKILHINSYYKVSNFYKNLYNEQIKDGLDINVFVPTTSLPMKNFDFGEYTTLSVNHTELDRILFFKKHRKITNDIVHQYNISEYDIIHAHSLFSNGYIALKVKELYDIPYVVAVRNTDVNVFFKKTLHLKRLGVKILKEASQIIFLSESYEKKVIKKYVPFNIRKEITNKSSIIPNGIDEFWFENKIEAKKKNKKCIKLLQVGDIDKNKNILTTVKVVDYLADKGYTLELNVVGKKKNNKIFSKLMKSSHVNYLGYKSKEELIKVYKDNDIFILPSITETFGLVYAEALSQGLPIIYTKGQGFDKQFPDGTVGFSVNCFDIKEIASAIKKITVEYEKISANCRKSIEKFSWQNIAAQYKIIYQNILLRGKLNESKYQEK